MLNLKNIRMKPKLIGLFIIASILPLIISGVLTYKRVSDELMVKSYSQLQAIREIKKQQIESFFNERLGDIRVLARNSVTVDAFLELDSAFKMVDPRDRKSFKGRMNEAYDAPESFRVVHDQYFPFFKYYMEQYGYYDLFLMDAQNGDVSFTVTKESDFGQRTENVQSSLRDVWLKAKQGETAISDTKPYSPSAGAPAQFVAAPIIDKSQVVGVVALQISLDAVNRIMQERSGMGETGETYLVGQDLLMRSDSFLDPNNHSVVASFKNPSKGKVETEGARNALKGKTDEQVIIDYNGNPVLSSYTPVSIGNITWGLLAEIDEAEVRGPIVDLLITMLVVAGVLAAIAAMIAFFLGGQITRPLIKCVDLAQVISQGDMTQTVDVKQEDEVGQLAISLNEMVTDLNKMFSEIASGVNTLTSSSTELSAVALQMASGADETSNRANTVATASEEMSANMNSVATATEQAATNVNMVAAAVEEITSTMNEITTNTTKTNLQTSEAASESSMAAERVNELGVAAQEISKVTEAITEISEQTNLLALNATIEAARAGDAGKGFAVVANEIKDLAKQTAEATQEIKTKIGTVQDSTSQTVEQISRVNTLIHGVNGMTDTVAAAIEEQSVTTREISGNVVQASQGIQEVTENVAQSSTVSTEVSREISEIDASASELQESSRQVSVSSDELSRLAETLTAMVNRFRLN